MIHLSEEAVYYIAAGFFFTIGIWIWVWWHIIEGWKRFKGRERDG